MLLAATIAPEAVVALVIGLVVGTLGWRAASRFRDQHGTTPWGAPPWLWGLLLLFSVLAGLIVLAIARSATLRDLSATAAVPTAPHPKRMRLSSAIALFVLGPAALVVGVVGLVASQHTDLASFTVASPGPTMVATATGSGGAQPTATLPAAKEGSGIAGTGDVPTTPTIYLVPARPTAYGVPSGTESTYWKVWWGATTQEKDVVSLQQHLDAADANQEISLLQGQDGDTANYDNAGVTFTSVGTFSIAAIPGSSGYLWSGTEGRNLSIQFRFVIFSRGDVVALVSTTAYGGNVDPAAFQTFAVDQYGQMAGASTSLTDHTAFTFLLDLGLVLLLTAVIALLGAVYRPRCLPAPDPAFHPAYTFPGYVTPPSPPQPPAPAATAGAPSQHNAGWYPDPADSGPGVLRYWDGYRWTPATSKPQPPQ